MTREEAIDILERAMKAQVAAEDKSLKELLSASDEPTIGEVARAYEIVVGDGRMRASLMSALPEHLR